MLRICSTWNGNPVGDAHRIAIEWTPAGDSIELRVSAHWTATVAGGAADRLWSSKWWRVAGSDGRYTEIGRTQRPLPCCSCRGATRRGVDDSHFVHRSHRGKPMGRHRAHRAPVAAAAALAGQCNRHSREARTGFLDGGASGPRPIFQPDRFRRSRRLLVAASASSICVLERLDSA